MYINRVGISSASSSRALSEIVEARKHKYRVNPSNTESRKNHKTYLWPYRSTQKVCPLPIDFTLGDHVPPLIDPDMGFMLETSRFGVRDLVDGRGERHSRPAADGFAP